MTYMKNGGLIRIVADHDVARFVEMGFAPMVESSEKPAKKPARRHKEAKPHGDA